MRHANRARYSNCFGPYLGRYRSDSGKLGTVEKLRLSAFQRCQARPNPIDIGRDTTRNGFSTALYYSLPFIRGSCGEVGDYEGAGQEIGLFRRGLPTYITEETLAKHMGMLGMRGVHEILMPKYMLPFFLRSFRIFLVPFGLMSRS